MVGWIEMTRLEPGVVEAVIGDILDGLLVVVVKDREIEGLVSTELYF